MRNIKIRNILISLFTILWILLFHYESLLFFFRYPSNPLFKKDLPQMKFLFPPLGWIMFFNVGEQFSHAAVYGIKNQVFHPIDPHLIFRTRTIMFDNIHRNILSEVLQPHQKEPFCRYLKTKFQGFDSFAVTVVFYPSVSQKPFERIEQIMYECH